MSTRVGFTLAVLLFLLAAAMRLIALSDLPPGFNDREITDLRLTEVARRGQIGVFYDLGSGGREGLTAGLSAALTSFTGAGMIGARLLPLAAGLITLALVYALGVRLCGTIGGLAALALLSINLTAILLSRAVGREAFLPLVMAALLLALARSLPVYRPDVPFDRQIIPFAALGILLGLGLYIHPLALGMALGAVGFIVYMLLFQRPIPRRTLSLTWFALVVLIVTATPYVLSSVQRPDLAGAARLFTTEPGIAATPLTMLTRSLNGVIFLGDADPIANVPGRPLIDLVSGFFVGIGLLVSLRYWRDPRMALVLLLLATTMPLVLLAADAPDFTTMGTLLPLIALLFGQGVATIYHSLRGRGRVVYALGLAALLIFNIQWTARDLFTVFARDDDAPVRYQTDLHHVARTIERDAETPTVICSQEAFAPDANSGLSDAQTMLLMLHRRDLPLRYVDCSRALIFPEGGERGRMVILPDAGIAVVSPELRAWLGDAEDGVVALDTAAALADRVGAFTTSAPVTFAPEAPGGFGVGLPPLRFSDNLTFLGYENRWSNSTYKPGDLLPIITYWRVDGDVPSDLRLFAHILSDPASCCAAQHDVFSALASGLRPRDVVVQISYVDLPFTMPDGVYGVSVGGYRESTAARLTVFDADAPRGTRIFLGQLTIAADG